MDRIRDAARCVGFWVAVVVLVCAVLSLHACGSITMKWDSTGNHPEKRTD